MPAVVGVTTSFTLNAVTATQIGQQNSGRTYCLITNNSGTIEHPSPYMAYVTFGGTTATTGGIPIPPGGSLEIQVGKGQMQGQVWAIAGSGTPLISYTES